MQLFCFDSHRGRLGYLYLLNSVVQKYEYHINSCCYSCTQTRHFGAEKRVAKYIYENLETFNNDKKWKSAQLMRISPETLSRVINRLKRKGLVQSHLGKLVLTDKQKMFDYIFD
jgi:CRP/FNR family transcriptional regulator